MHDALILIARAIVQRVGLDRVAYLEDGNLKFLLPVQEILSSTGAKRLSEALPRMLETNALSNVL